MRFKEVVVRFKEGPMVLMLWLDGMMMKWLCKVLFILQYELHSLQAVSIRWGSRGLCRTWCSKLN
jgi:hypothetical protein